MHLQKRKQWQFGSRVLWKFISGIQCDFIRQEKIRQKWMTDEGKLSFEDLLSIVRKPW